jgi:hypothetical protein
MTFLLAVLAGAAGAAIGWFVGGIAAVMIAGWFGMSDFEGARGFFAFVVVGPIVGLVGLGLGILLVLRYRGGHRALPALAGRGALVVLALAAIVGGAIWYRFATLPHFSGAEPKAEFEIRWPAGKPAPTRNGLRIELHTDRNTTDALLGTDWRGADGGRPVVRGLVPLYFRTAQRILVLKLAGEPDRLFTLRLGATPRYSDQYGAWQKLDYVAADGEQPRRPRAGEEFELRLRVTDPSVPFVQSR